MTMRQRLGLGLMMIAVFVEVAKDNDFSVIALAMISIGFYGFVLLEDNAK